MKTYQLIYKNFEGATRIYLFSHTSPVYAIDFGQWLCDKDGLEYVTVEPVSF